MTTKNLSWKEALKKLKEGNIRFVKDKTEGNLQHSDRRQELASGQNPFAIILSCADSRVVPDFIFDTELGELFVVRVAGNISNTSSIASIEFAASSWGVELIVVVGHESCGAVEAAIKGGDNGRNLNQMLAYIIPAVEASDDKSLSAVVKKNAELTAKSLTENSEILRDVPQDLKIIPAFYHLASGKIDFLTE